jgi:hypothetical protein
VGEIEGIEASHDTTGILQNRDVAGVVGGGGRGGRSRHGGEGRRAGQPEGLAVKVQGLLESVPVRAADSYILPRAGWPEGGHQTHHDASKSPHNCGKSLCFILDPFPGGSRSILVAP